MKKTLIALSILGAIGFTTANYTLKYPLEQAKGGSLPNGSITISNQTPMENWVPFESIYTGWINRGSLIGCSNWSPEPSTVEIGETFTQTATDCEQQQIRTRQDREQETTTKAIRDVGAPVEENQTIAATDTREAIGSLKTIECLYDRLGYTIEDYLAPSTTTIRPEVGYIRKKPPYSNNIIIKSKTWGINVSTTDWKYTKDGYRYTLGEQLETGEFIKDDGSIYTGYYQVCREKL